MAEKTIMKQHDINTVEHWKRLSESFRMQRVMEVRYVQLLQNLLYIYTCLFNYGNVYVCLIFVSVDPFCIAFSHEFSGFVMFNWDALH